MTDGREASDDPLSGNPALDQDDATPRGSRTCAQRGEDRRRVKGQQIAKGLAVPREEPSVMVAACEDEEDRHRSRIIALLQAQTAFKRLGVTDVGLEIRKERRPGPGDHGVPGAEIAFDRQPDLALNPQGRAETGDEAIEQGELRRITHRLSDGEHPDRRPHPQHPGCAAHPNDVGSSKPAALEAAPLRRRHGSGMRGRRLGDARGPPSLAELPGDRPREISGVLETLLRASGS
jgi:hypothetical protein